MAFATITTGFRWMVDRPISMTGGFRWIEQLPFGAPRKDVCDDDNWILEGVRRILDTVRRILEGIRRKSGGGGVTLKWDIRWRSMILGGVARIPWKGVSVIQKRHHVGGNCYDFIDEETKIQVNKYGAHLRMTRRFGNKWICFPSDTLLCMQYK